MWASHVNLSRCTRLRSIILITTSYEFSEHVMRFFTDILSTLPPAQRLETLEIAMRVQDWTCKTEWVHEKWVGTKGWRSIDEECEKVRDQCPEDGIVITVEHPWTWDEHLREGLGALGDALPLRLEAVDRIEVFDYMN